jgi:hypothetical protein
LPTAHLTAPAKRRVVSRAGDDRLHRDRCRFRRHRLEGRLLLNGNQVASSPTRAVYTATATGVAAGSYSVKARATDNDGAAGPDSPEHRDDHRRRERAADRQHHVAGNGAAITAPADVPITATATDSDGSIAKVEFFGDGVLLKTVTTGAYNATWTNVPLGDRTILVRATDNDGGVGFATATIHVTGIRSQITAPPDGSSYVGPAAFDLVAGLRRLPGFSRRWSSTMPAPC